MIRYVSEVTTTQCVSIAMRKYNMYHHDMKLHAYINSWPRYQRRSIREQIAQQLGITEGAIRHWANGTRRIPAEQVLALESATGGRVTRYELRPDLYPTAEALSAATVDGQVA